MMPINWNAYIIQMISGVKQNVWGTVPICMEQYPIHDLKTLSIYLFYDDVRAATEKQAINEVNAFQAMFEQRKNILTSL